MLGLPQSGLRWEVQLKACVDSSPLIITSPENGDGYICYVVDFSGHVSCIDGHSGNVHWSRDLGMAVEVTASKTFESIE